MAKDKKTYATTIESDSDSEISKSEAKKSIEKVNIAVQTEGLNLNELEEQLFEKRLANLQDFSSYQTKLEQKDQLISQLQQRLSAYRAKLKTFLPHTNNQEKNAVIIFLLVILTSILFLK